MKLLILLAAFVAAVSAAADPDPHYYGYYGYPSRYYGSYYGWPGYHRGYYGGGYLYGRKKRSADDAQEEMSAIAPQDEDQQVHHEDGEVSGGPNPWYGYYGYPGYAHRYSYGYGLSPYYAYPTGYHYTGLYRGWYGRKKRAVEEGEETGADAQSGPQADSYYHGYYGNPWGYYGYGNYYGRRWGGYYNNYWPSYGYGYYGRRWW